MAAAVVYEGVADIQGETGALFQGQKFWFSRQVPQRSWFIENVVANGGHVFALEKQADILIVDHVRKNLPANSHSYKYIELSIENGRLERLEDHAVGPRHPAARPVGSVTTAPKGSRTPFTGADDQFLWNWVKPAEEQRGWTKGNTLFQQLEAVNPRHTYQSWRDRWIKYVSHQNREITEAAHYRREETSQLHTTSKKPASKNEKKENNDKDKAAGCGNEPPRQRDTQRRTPRSTEETPSYETANASTKASISKAVIGSAFTEEEAKTLYIAAGHIINCEAKMIGRAWESMAEENTAHPAEAWREFFETSVRPIYEKEQGRHTSIPRSAHFISAVGGADHKIQTSSTRVTRSLWGNQPEHSSPDLHSPTQPVKAETSNDNLPGPNEARKRDNAREAGSLHGRMPHEEHMVFTNGQNPKHDMGPNQKRNLEVNDPSSPLLSHCVSQGRKKRRKSLKDGLSDIEIPSTPDHDKLRKEADEPRRSQELSASPTPKPRRLPGKHHATKLAGPPLLVPGDQREPDLGPETPRPSMEADPRTTTSPLDVRLVSERGPPLASSFSQSVEDAKDDNGSPTPEFETAPDFSQKWETAPEAQGATTATKPSTQALFKESLVDDFALPEPEGGWDDMAVMPPLEEEEEEEKRRGDNEVVNTTEDVPSDSPFTYSVDSWIDGHLARDPAADEELLLQAIAATNLNFRLADMVYGVLSRGARLPDGVEGVWTERDDEKLMGGDARSILEMERKHGKEAVEERWTFLEHSR